MSKTQLFLAIITAIGTFLSGFAAALVHVKKLPRPRVVMVSGAVVVLAIFGLGAAVKAGEWRAQRLAVEKARVAATKPQPKQIEYQTFDGRRPISPDPALAKRQAEWWASYLEGRDWAEQMNIGSEAKCPLPKTAFHDGCLDWVSHLPTPGS